MILRAAVEDLYTLVCLIFLAEMTDEVYLRYLPVPKSALKSACILQVHTRR